MSGQSLTHTFHRIRVQLEDLPEAYEPPETLIQLLGKARSERTWQDLLVYFLTPDEPHGFDSALLEHVLTAIAERDDTDFEYSKFDLPSTEIEQEVVTDHGRPDIVIWCAEDWFICWELKVEAMEGDDQTIRYEELCYFNGIDLHKRDVREAGHHYIYLVPDEASCPESDAFVKISWEWFARQLQRSLSESYGEYPARATVQLEELIDTIRGELIMTEYKENRSEKTDLYAKHFDEIQELERAYEEEWERFKAEWGSRLTKIRDEFELVSDPDVPDEFVACDILLDEEEGKKERWVFRQNVDDWGWMFPKQWWRDNSTGEYVYSRTSTSERVGFLHRLEKHRGEAIEDKKLKFILRNAGANSQQFKDTFSNQFHTSTIREEAPRPEGVKGNRKENVIELNYDIEVERHGGFLEAYLTALGDALAEHVIEAPGFKEEVDSIYEDAFKVARNNS